MALADVVSALRCPQCEGALALTGGSLRCGDGHTYDVARHGYVNLLPGSHTAATADTAAMVEARTRFLGAGHFEPIAQAVAEAVASAVAQPRTVVDVGAGTGYYLAAVLDRVPVTVGVALDLAKHAARRAARAHPAIGAAVCDVWQPLPVQTGVADAVVNVFAPRNGAEMHRILRQGGAVVVVTPAADHLAEIVEPLGLLNVADDKPRRLATTLQAFVLESSLPLRFSCALSRDDVEAVVAMGPSAWHVDAAAAQKRVAALPSPALVTASVNVDVYRTR